MTSSPFEPKGYQGSDLRLSEAAPIVGRALDVPAETIIGFVIVGVQRDGALGIAASENLDAHTAAHLLEAMADAIFADLRARHGQAGQN